tara:strand:- start:124 stop:735 length:612 start_codon:yes stop_codon:yes gene_type:complete
MKVHTFGIPIFEYNIKEDTSDLLSYQGGVSNSKNSQSAISSHLFEVLEEYKNIKKIFTDFFNDFAYHELGIDSKFMISTSWITHTETGQDSNIHDHKNCFFSGVYYFDDRYDEDAGKLVFNNPIKKFTSFSFDYITVNPLNKNAIQITPKPKKLVLFPSYLDHYVSIHHSKIERKSLAFNFVPIGDYGVVDSSFKQSWYNRDN